MARTKKSHRRPRIKPPSVPERYASGDRKPTDTGPACTPEILAHRRQAMPDLDDKTLMTNRAGLPLEMLFAQNLITRAQRDAGERYGKVVHRWRLIKGVRDGTRQAKPGAGNEIDPVVADRVTREYIACRRAIESLTPIAQAAIQTVCVDEGPSRIMDKSMLGDRLRKALREGLNQLCGVFQIREAA